MRVLLLGAGGTVGRELQAQRPPNHEILPYTHAQLDIRDEAGVNRLLREHRPSWVINAGGVTDVDRAEREPELAYDVNSAAVGVLAASCRTAGCGLVHFSTDFVFDGSKSGCYSEDDAPAPVNTYGASKLEGEERVRRSGIEHLVLRTQWVFGAGGTSFLSTLWQRARAGTPLRVVADQFGCCTYAADLAAVAWDAMGKLTGTYHVANRGRVSRLEIARRIYAAAGAAHLVQGCSAAELTAPARRPASSALCVDKVERDLGRRMPEWTDAVDRYLARVRAASAVPSERTSR